MTGAVLAGGRSARMGANKALLELEGARLIDRLLRTMQPLFGEIVIIANDPDTYRDLRLAVLPDRIPGKGALGGVYTAVSLSRFPRTFCIGCDMPFPNADVIAYLQRAGEGYDVVVPRTAAGYEPLHAVYDKACLPWMEAMIQADRLRIDHLFSQVRVRTVGEEELRPLDPSLRCFMNINTPEELAAAVQLARHGSPPSAG